MTKEAKSIEEINGEKIYDFAPDYIQVNGYVYERHSKIDDGSVTLSLDLTENSMRVIEDFRRNNPGYVNDQEVIREALRQAIKENELCISQRNLKTSEVD